MAITEIAPFYSGYTTTSTSGTSGTPDIVWFAATTGYGNFYDSVKEQEELEKERERTAGLLKFHCLNFKLIPHPNPLPIIAKAVNRVKSAFAIKQPCWRSGRWKSLT